MKSLMLASILASAVLVQAGPSAGQTGGPARLTNAEIAMMVAKTTDGLATGQVPTGPKGPQVVIAHREKSGEVEVHDNMNDVFVAHKGKAVVLVGGQVTGQRQTAPGEWRGGTVTGATSYALNAGEILWIPAGLPHQVIVAKGRTFTYLAFKSAK